MRFPGLLLVGCLAFSSTTSAGTDTPVPRTLTIPRVSQPPKLDDFLDMEPTASHGLVAVEGFTQRTPDDGKPATQRTVVYLGYDLKNLYVIFVCFDVDPDRIRARLGKREDNFADDLVGVMLDTFHDRRRGYFFLANPLGIQADALMAEGQGEDYSFDTLWYSEGKRTPGGYVVRIAIPFKSLRFPSEPTQVWGIAFGRNTPYRNESSWWPHLSIRLEAVLSQLAQLEGLENVSPGHNLQFIPYGFFRSFRALDTLNAPPRFVRDSAEPEFGLDAKVVLKDSLVFDLALNPDFSQVESDEPQVTVNQRFEVFFPEKRPFFLENSTFFRTPINLLFTRRIADPQYGVRLTGKLGRYALGAFLIDDQAPGKRIANTDPLLAKLLGQRAFFGIVRVNRDLFRQSTLGLIATAREFEGSFNRLAGPDLRLKLNPNWVLEAQAVTSNTHTFDERLSGPAYRLELNRSGRSFNYSLAYNDLSPGFRAAVGFVPRVDIRDINQFAGYRIWPKHKHILHWGPHLFLQRIWNHEGVRQDWVVSPSFNFELRRQVGFFVSYRAKHERFEGIDFHKRGLSGEIGMFAFSKVSFFSRFQTGTEINFSPANGRLPFLADQANFNFGTTVRPLNPLRIDNTYIFSRLAERRTGANIFTNHIARTKVNYQFTRRLSFRGIFQYDATLANPGLTTVRTNKRFTSDFLLTYLVNPGTVLYLGYNDMLENLDPRLLLVDDQLLRTQRGFLKSGKQLFVKFSYLFRF